MACDAEPTEADLKAEMKSFRRLFGEKANDLLKDLNADKGGIYVIKPARMRRNLIKVGSSKNILRRLFLWNSSFPYGVEILGVGRIRRKSLDAIDYDPVENAERRLKAALAKYRPSDLYPGREEWIDGADLRHVLDTLKGCVEYHSSTLQAKTYVAPRHHLRRQKLRMLFEAPCSALDKYDCTSTRKGNGCVWKKIGPRKGACTEKDVPTDEGAAVPHRLRARFPGKIVSGVYVFQMRGFSEAIIKVGCSENLQRRIGEWQQSNPFEIDVHFWLGFDLSTSSAGHRRRTPPQLEKFVLSQISTPPLPGTKEWFPAGALPECRRALWDAAESRSAYHEGFLFHENALTVLGREKAGPVWQTPRKGAGGRTRAQASEETQCALLGMTDCEAVPLSECRGHECCEILKGISAPVCGKKDESIPCRRRFRNAPPYCDAQPTCRLDLDAVRGGRKYALCRNVRDADE